MHEIKYPPILQSMGIDDFYLFVAYNKHFFRHKTLVSGLQFTFIVSINKLY